jgi:hypothetical protein
MNRHIPHAATAVFVLAVAAWGIDPAVAAAATSDIGRNVGDELRTWATTLLLGVAGLVALPVLMKRDVNGGIVLALLVILVGGFAYAPGSVKHVIEALWRTIAG